MLNMGLLYKQCRGIGPHPAVKGKSRMFSRVVVGTWGTLSSYGGDGHSKLVFVQPHQDSCLQTRESSIITTRLGNAIGTLLEVRQETEGH